jgi:hypothetical protein
LAGQLGLLAHAGHKVTDSAGVMIALMAALLALILAGLKGACCHASPLRFGSEADPP